MLTYKYCPYCKGTLKKDALEKGTLRCLSCKRKIHIHSSPTSSVLPVKGNLVLLSKRGEEPKKGAFDAVGGFLRLGEHPEEGAIREAKEETGCSIELIKLLGVYMGNDYEYQGDMEDSLNFYYVGKITKGKMKAKEDVASLHWVPINNPLKMAFFYQKNVMKDFQEWYQKKVKSKNSKGKR